MVQHRKKYLQFLISLYGPAINEDLSRVKKKIRIHLPLTVRPLRAGEFGLRGKLCIVLPNDIFPSFLAHSVEVPKLCASCNYWPCVIITFSFSFCQIFFLPPRHFLDSEVDGSSFYQGLPAEMKSIKNEDFWFLIIFFSLSSCKKGDHFFLLGRIFLNFFEPSVIFFNRLFPM